MDELHAPPLTSTPPLTSAIRPSSKVTLHTEKACCKSIFQVFKMFYSDVVSVSYGCYKNILGYCICRNSFTRMLQVFVPNASAVFTDVCCKCVYSDVTYVLHICCKCFI
jgi:hypothetical protein